MSPRGRGVSLLFLFFSFLFSLSSCKPSLPSGVLSESKMEQILYDYHMAQALAEVTRFDSHQSLDVHRYELQESVLRKHGITQAEFDSSMVYYCSDMERLNTIYNHVSQRLDREVEALDITLGSSDTYAGLSADGDTANVWSGRQVFSVRNRIGENLQSWRISCDSTWMEGDDLLWRFNPTCFMREGFQNLYVTLVVEYTNDSIRANTLQCTNRTITEIRIDNSEGWKPKVVNGFFYLPVNDDGYRPCIYIINKVALIRFHKSQEWRDRLSKADNLEVDSIQSDTLDDAASSARSAGAITSDSLQYRRSPIEFRNQQDVEHKIQIVKEKPFNPQQQQQRRRKKQQKPQQRLR